MEKLYRSRRNKMISGICGGLADRFNFDATLIRILVVVGTIVTSGGLLIVYLLSTFVIPKEPNLYDNAYEPARTQWDHWDPQPATSYSGYGTGSVAAYDADAGMNDLEKAALRRELDQCRFKIAQYEKGE
ncbi:PspC domain-containing protein [Paenibacillus sp. GCM10012307]|uniref:PspC domain-containing protein n=1 Tax=Paenibacillus roseus TaxID=2798579 RepID=A0A934IVR3_9BACL|nr:PspC domain-containing protein [Paenibacillus roseus]MBJ6360196.1 PspC domain-containing protein [Paenibacillus roseus]